MGNVVSTCVGGGGALLACHIDICICFRSLVLPPQYRQSLRLRVDDIVYAFKALPFGWAYSPVICKEVLTAIVRKADVREVIGVIYYDDILIIRFGADHVQPAANTIVTILVSKGALVSSMSKMTPLDCIDWIGKQFRFGEGVITASTNKWSALLARWLLLVSTAMCGSESPRTLCGKQVKFPMSCTNIKIAANSTEGSGFDLIDSLNATRLTMKLAFSRFLDTGKKDPFGPKPGSRTGVKTPCPMRARAITLFAGRSQPAESAP